MGKNLKGRFSYKYLHGTGVVPAKYLQKLFKKWNRHNFHTNEMKVKRISNEERFVNKNMIEDINDYQKDK